MSLKKINRSGFVMLFAVTISAILLAIALGVANIALKEVKFGTSAEVTNNAFFAADSAIESVLFADKPPGSPYIAPMSLTIVKEGLGSSSTNCAIVTITKDNSIPPVIKTTVISKGYNIGASGTCAPTNPDRTEREIDVTY